MRSIRAPYAGESSALWYNTRMQTLEERKKYLEIYRSKPENKAKHRLAAKKWALANASRVKVTKRIWKTQNPTSYTQYSREYNRRQRTKVLNHYSGGNPKCVCCGEKEIKFLCIDHISGGGNTHRREMKIRGSIIPWIVKNKFPPMFQVLCYNCNNAKGFWGECPHKKDLGSQSD